MKRAGRLVSGAFLVLGGFCALAVAAPRVLAFPYYATSNGQRVWSETPIDLPALNRLTARSTALVNASPLSNEHETRDIYLTQGGWRWTVLALQTRGSFALTRAVNDAILVNRSDMTRDLVWNGGPSGRARSLSGVLAHETCHGMERRRFGFAVDLAYPTWLTEGYCDHVARESTLTASDVARLKAQGGDHPAIIYYEGRRRAAEILNRNGGDVDALFAQQR